MGTWHSASWSNDHEHGLRRDRRSGAYSWYEPDLLVTSPLLLTADTDRLVAQAERDVRALDGPMRDLAGIARFLLRSEAIASSRIEGISPSAKQIAFAELGQDEEVGAVSASARLVANNMTVVRQATSRLLTTDELTVHDIETLHRSLLPDEERHHRLRTVQNWIGGSSRHPLDAEFVPPHPDRVPALMEDLTAYLNGAAHSPIVHAALAHAQFETIHPFTDGNGRLGRALIHTTLGRRGLTNQAVLPVSLVLATLSTDYVSGLTAFRTDARPGTSEWHQAREHWIRIFAESTCLACDQARLIAVQVADVRDSWLRRHDEHRTRTGSTRALRNDSAVVKVLDDLPATPVLTTSSVMRIHDVSRQSALRALEELREAGILTTRSAGPRTTAYVADDILETITWAERRLASTRFDTRACAPRRPVPAPPAT